MSKEIKAFECITCGEVHKDEKLADRCCKCNKCGWYIGRTPRRCGRLVIGGASYVHCSKGYTCDSFQSHGDEGSYSQFKNK